MNEELNIIWFRRDLRLTDNAALYHALRGPHPILPLFIFDKEILDKLNNSKDARVHFIHDTLTALKKDLEEKGTTLLVKYGDPKVIWASLIKTFNIRQVYTNHDFEPYAIQRDIAIKELLNEQDIDFKTYKDHVIFEKDEVLKDDGKPYTVFTPYSRKWRKKLATRLATNSVDSSYYLKSYPTAKYFDNFKPYKSVDIPSLESMGFEPSDIEFPSSLVARKIIKQYDQTRNFPAIHGTSRLGVHFRFGTISIREKARAALGLNDTYLSELIWRDFYAMILSHFPKVVKSPFREKYKGIAWRNNEEEFRLWCEGKTGYPIVDAGMRELNTTGYMHNRVRMVVASFLTKHLLINWQWGEAYFAEKLLDFDLASNNGGWQWAAGCGTDAAPYFRIFNPESQQKKFDKEWKYIKKWVPEFGTPDYTDPIVDHKMARERCLATYKETLNQFR